MIMFLPDDTTQILSTVVLNCRLTVRLLVIVNTRFQILRISTLYVLLRNWLYSVIRFHV